MEGKVIAFDELKGTGTILADNGEELPVHRSAIEDGEQPKLYEGDLVEFRVGRNKFGSRAALAVRRIGWDESDGDDTPREWTF